MKIDEILVDSQLDEIKLKHAIAAGVLGASLALTPGNKTNEKPDPVNTVLVKKETKSNELAEIVAKNYDVDQEQAKKIVDLVQKHAKQSFPTTEDMLAIIGIESGFDPHAQSRLKKDPAVGLTQIRPKMWGLDASSLKGNLDTQIKKAVEILSHNYERLGSKDDAVHAYNIGIKNVIHKKKPNLKYVTKWKAELKKYI